MKTLNTATQSAEVILSALSPEARNAIAQHYEGMVRSEIAKQIYGGHVGSSLAEAPPKPAARKAQPSAPAPVVHGRQRTNDGTNRTASEWIRNFDVAHPGTSANDVVVESTKVGLAIVASLVYNVRQNLKKEGVANAATAAAAVVVPVIPAAVVEVVESAPAPAEAPVADAPVVEAAPVLPTEDDVAKAERKANQNAALTKARAVRAANHAAKVVAANAATAEAAKI